MVVYVACCKSQDEAIKVQSKLISTTPTLVFSRILKHVRELDAYDPELFTSSDEHAPIGQLVFGDGLQSAKLIQRALLRRLAVIVAVVGIALLIEVRAFGGLSSRSLLAIAVLVGTFVVGLVLAGVAAKLAFIKMTPDRMAFVRAANNLKHRMPVVIAGSDESPDPGKQLPANVVFFEQKNDVLRRFVA